MKYVSFTFDDGRKDNFTYAYPIMKKYNILGTLYCTTGYIDGTWTKERDWYSAGEAISVEELRELAVNGWELALHGDKHTTEVQDLKIASGKMTAWGFINRPMGFSMPNSNISREKLNAVIDAYLGTEISYIRTGRRISTKQLSSRILFALYTYGKQQWAYNKFNNKNLNRMDSVDLSQVYSIVIRNNDDPDMVAKFLAQIPDNTWAVLMLHSIWPESHELYGSDPWNWSEDRFNKFCFNVKKLVDSRKIEVRTVIETINLFL